MVLSQTKFGDKSVMENVRQIIPIFSSMDQKGSAACSSLKQKCCWLLSEEGNRGKRKLSYQSTKLTELVQNTESPLKTALNTAVQHKLESLRPCKILNLCFRRSGIISALQNFQQKDYSLSPCFICARSSTFPKINIVEEETKTQSSSNPSANLQCYQLPELGW